jgi:uncharacterized membrane protein
MRMLSSIWSGEIFCASADKVAEDHYSYVHRVFLWIALPLGLLYVICSPAFTVPDEHTHFFRIYHLSEGGLIAEKQENATGDYLPKSLANTTFIYTLGIYEKSDGIITPEIFKATFAIDLNPSDKTFIAFSNTALYSFVPYIPQTIAVFAGRILNASPMALLYMGRLANFLLAVLLLTVAIRILPFFKYVFMMVLLTPTSMYQLASLSADGLTVSFSVLFVALVLQFAYGSCSRMSTAGIISLFILSVGICLSKAAYFLFPVLILLIPASRFPRPSRHILLKVSIVAAGWIAMGLWSFLIKDIYSTSYALEHIDPQAAKEFILSSPLNFIIILVHSIVSHGWSYIETFIGIQDWDLIVLPRPVIVIYALTLAISGLATFRSAIKISVSNKIVLSAIGWASFIIALTLVYMSWTPAGSHMVVGFQGRYLIPLLPLILIPLYNAFRTPQSLTGFVRYLVPFVVCASLLIALIMNVFKFYVA